MLEFLAGWGLGTLLVSGLSPFVTSLLTIVCLAVSLPIGGLALLSLLHRGLCRLLPRPVVESAWGLGFIGLAVYVCYLATP
jgi:hypothetical protein